MPMFWAVRQLTVPAKYLRIRHGENLLHSKKVYDWIIPIVIVLVVCAIFFWLGIPFSILDQPELSKRLIDLLVLMIVFYMAALAAVSTFDRKGIDTLLQDQDALLWTQNSETGEYFDKKLTYREFISYLFGYLSFLSLVLYVFIVALSVVWPVLLKHFKDNATISEIIANVVDPAIFLVVFGVMAQLVITSLLGIYFLTERIQTLNNSKE